MMAPSAPDVIIIGAGQAGVPLATRLVKAGQTVLLVERALLGGTCVNYGCTPTKTMVASARAAHVARTSAGLGIHTGEVRVDLAAIVERKNATVLRWRAGVEDHLRRAGENLRVLHGHARFVGTRTIKVGEATYTAPRIVVNVGTRPKAPDVPGASTVPWLDNRRLMDLREIPEHLIVLGGGYIGCEFAQMFRRFGARVTIVHKGKHLMSREDPDTVAALEAALLAEGLQLELGAEVRTLAPTAAGVMVTLAGGREIRGSHLLVATGRLANTTDLGHREGGIELDRQGFVVVDDRYQTSSPGVYAVGDVTGGPQFTHTAWDDHRVLFDQLVGRPSRKRSERLVPFTMFTDPQYAGVGLSETEARAGGVTYEVATMPFGQIARAIETGEEAGILKVLLDPQTEHILGARIVGAEAGELIHIFASLMQAGASARAIVDAEYVHPSFAEGVQSVVMRLARYALS